MKTTILALFLALQTTAAFATTQTLTCKGGISDELGEVKKPISAVLKIVNPVVQDLLIINGEAAASERVSIVIAGWPAIQIDGINVTNLRKAVSISGYRKDSFSLSAYVPVPSIGKEGSVAVEMSGMDSNNSSFYIKLVCNSTLANSL